MKHKTLVLLSAVAILGVSSTAMAGGMVMHSGGSGGRTAMHGHGHVVHHFHFKRNFVHNFRNPIFLGGWGWDWGLGGYDYGSAGNTTVVVLPQAVPQAANVTGSSDPRCHWHDETYTVPSSAGGTRPITVKSCQ
jgi:hypothetical protein